MSRVRGTSNSPVRGRDVPRPPIRERRSRPTAPRASRPSRDPRTVPFPTAACPAFEESRVEPPPRLPGAPGRLRGPAKSSTCALSPGIERPGAVPSRSCHFQRRSVPFPRVPLKPSRYSRVFSGPRSPPPRTIRPGVVAREIAPAGLRRSLRAGQHRARAAADAVVRLRSATPTPLRPDHPPMPTSHGFRLRRSSNRRRKSGKRRPGRGCSPPRDRWRGESRSDSRRRPGRRASRRNARRGLPPGRGTESAALFPRADGDSGGIVSVGGRACVQEKSPGA